MYDNDALAERITFSANNPRRDPAKELDLRARKLMSGDRKLEYRDAMRQVMTADPDLHRLYLDTDTPLRPIK